MDVVNYLSVLGLTLVVAGWLVSYYLAKKKEIRLSVLKWKKEQIDKQLELLYGPIFAILMENKGSRDVLRDAFCRGTLFEYAEKLNEKENEEYTKYLENTLIPNNRKIVEIIRNNLYLVPDSNISKNFIEFIKYSKKIEYIHSHMKSHKEPYGQHGYENYHADFQKEIQDMVVKLKKEQWSLVNKYRPKKKDN